MNAERAAQGLRRIPLEVHHLTERRFRHLFGTSSGGMMSMVLTRAEHQVFTNAWRGRIGYGAETRRATRQGVEAAFQYVYRDILPFSP